MKDACHGLGEFLVEEQVTLPALLGAARGAGALSCARGGGCQACPEEPGKASHPRAGLKDRATEQADCPACVPGSEGLKGAPRSRSLS